MAFIKTSVGVTQPKKVDLQKKCSQCGEAHRLLLVDNGEHWCRECKKKAEEAQSAP